MASVGLGQLLRGRGVVGRDVVRDRGGGARQVLLFEGLERAPVAADEDGLGDDQRDERSEDQRAGKEHEKADPTASRTPTHDSDIIAAASSHSSGGTVSSTRALARSPRAGRRRGRAPSPSCRARGRRRGAPRSRSGSGNGPRPREDRAHGRRVGFGQAGARARDLERRRDAPRDRLAVAQRPEAARGLEGVAERVAEVQQAPPPRVLRVGRDDRRLDADRAREQVEQRRLVAREDRRQAPRRALGERRRRRSRRPCRPRRARPGSRGRAASRRPPDRSGSPPADGRRPSRFLPSAVIDAGLAADRGVRHARPSSSAPRSRPRRAAGSPRRSRRRR